MNTIAILRVLQIALGALGGIPALMALYDIILGENHATSGSNKKLIGGIVFGTIAVLVMQGVISEMEKAQSITGSIDNTSSSIVYTYQIKDHPHDITVA